MKAARKMRYVHFILLKNQNRSIGTLWCRWEDNIKKDIVSCYLGTQPIRKFIARQQLPCNNGSAVGSGVFYVVQPDAISRQ
jgi:hypothetical protein